jgi:broad specificity phosphatase PhoE
MTSTITWMRHGTCADGRDQPDAHARPASPLTPLGACQAARAAGEIAGRADAVASSALTRARTTARIVADRSGLTLLPADAVFNEWRAPACVLGRTPAQYPDAYKEWRRHRARNPDDALPGGESLTAFRDRALDALQTAEHLARAHSRLVVVSHRLLIGAIAALRSGTYDAAEVFEAARAFTLRPAALHLHDPEGSH